MADPVNENILCLASGANPAAGNTPDFDNIANKGVAVVVDMTAFTSGTFTVIIEGKDPLSGKYYPLLTSAALGAIATTVLSVYPGGPATANLAANANLPRVWRVRWTSATPVLTVSVAANTLA
jgi:hypothetical protein